jgi:DNA polymerase-4
MVPFTLTRQLDLFDMDRYEKLAKMDDTVDHIRGRYGKDAVVRSVFVNNGIYHMSGGISREKKRPKYEGGILQ